MFVFYKTLYLLHEDDYSLLNHNS